MSPVAGYHVSRVQHKVDQGIPSGVGILQVIRALALAPELPGTRLNDLVLRPGARVIIIRTPEKLNMNCDHLERPLIQSLIS